MHKLVLLIVILLSVTAVRAQDDDLTPLNWTFGGLERTYYLHVPEHLPDPAPLVIALHGRLGDGKGMARLTHFSDLADREGFLVAYPNGVNGEWNFVRDVPGYDMTQDDTAFLTALIDHIAEDQAVDRTRVYLAGFSNGGFMAQRAACEAPTPFAAFASVSAAAFGGMTQVCPLTSAIPVPMLLMNGTADTNIPWDGTPVTRGDQTIYVTYPVADTLGYWAQMNHCPAEADTTIVPALGESPDTQVRILTLHCPSDTGVVLYMVVGGGHNWSGQPAVDSPMVGSINRDINASEEIWRFFTRHRRLPQSEAEATENAP